MAHLAPGTFLAAEDAQFTLTDTTVVRYGNDTTFFTQTLAAGTYFCSNAQFGGDPTPFVVKDCEVAVPLPEGGLIWTEEDDANAMAGTVTATGASGSLIWTEETDLNAATGTETFSGSLIWTEANDANASAGTVSGPFTGTVIWTEASDTNASAGTVTQPVSGSLVWTEGDDTFLAAGTSADPVSGSAGWVEADDSWLIAATDGTAEPTRLVGFEMVSFKPLLQRIMESRAERVKPATSNARKKARVIEVQAAQIALADGNEAEFRALMDRWLAQRPVMPEAQGIDPYQLFMAQVAMQIERMREIERFEQDEEDALIALLL